MADPYHIKQKTLSKIEFIFISEIRYIDFRKIQSNSNLIYFWEINYFNEKFFKAKILVI